MNHMKKMMAALGCAVISLPLFAQYPVIPEDVKAIGAKHEAEFDRKSKLAWEKALPVVLQEAVQGRL